MARYKPVLHYLFFAPCTAPTTQPGPLRLRRLRGEIATALAREPARADPIRLGMLWLESDLEPDPRVLSRAADVARSRLDLALAERFARAAADARPDPATKLLLAYVLFMRENGTETEQLLSTIDGRDIPATGFVSPVILRSANLLWVLRRPEAARAVIEDALRGGQGTRAAHNDALRTFRAVQLVLAGKPAETCEAMAGVDFEQLDDFGRTLALCALTIALGDLGRPNQAAEKASTGYAVVAESPQNTYQGTGLAEFHAYALVAAGYVEEAVAVAEARHRICAELPGMASAMATATVGMTALYQGDLRAALRRLGQAAAGLGGYGEISGIFYRYKILHTEALARARQLAEQCGGATSPALAAATVTLPLTEREREIALLVAQGLSNRRIAEAMSLSVRTVEGHIYRATVKAGVATRDELSSVVRQFDSSVTPSP
jgi:DNA-binding CsgD family transcriptional regulator